MCSSDVIREVLTRRLTSARCHTSRCFTCAQSQELSGAKLLLNSRHHGAAIIMLPTTSALHIMCCWRTAAPEAVAESPKLISDAPSQSVQAPVAGLGASATSLQRAAERGGTGVVGLAPAACGAAMTGLPNSVPLPSTEGELPAQDTSGGSQLPTASASDPEGGSDMRGPR